MVPGAWPHTWQPDPCAPGWGRGRQSVRDAQRRVDLFPLDEIDDRIGQSIRKIIPSCEGRLFSY